MRSTVLLGLLLAACSGNGISTTARTTGDTAGSESGADGGPGGGPGDDSADAGGEGSDGGGMDGDSSGGDQGSEDSGPGTPVELQGVWVSEGANVAPLLVELTAAQKITATFGPDTFQVLTEDDTGQEVTQIGIYIEETTQSGEVMSIVLEQTSPQTVTAEGIYEIDNSVDPPMMRYEVVQTQPDVGAGAPPSADLGFGGTQFGDDLTQVYVRQ